MVYRYCLERLKSVGITLTVVLYFGICFGQSDSSIVAVTKWKTVKIASGIRLRSSSYHQSLFRSNQQINILEISPGKKYRLDVEAEVKRLKPTSEFGAAVNAIAALNGTFFDTKNGGSMDYIRIDGAVVSPNRLQANNIRALHQKAAITFDEGRIDISNWDGTAGWEENLTGEDVMVSGPLLVLDRSVTPLDSSTVYMTRHPRSAVAIKGKKVLLITIDGRSKAADGMNLHELAYFVKWLGVDEAINLDGGGSTTLWIRENNRSRIVNQPSDKASGHQFPASDRRQFLERPVANVITVKKKK